MLRFGAGNQHAFIDVKLPSVELLLMGEVLSRLTFEPLMQIAPVVDPLELGQARSREWA